VLRPSTETTQAKVDQVVVSAVAGRRGGRTNSRVLRRLLSPLRATTSARWTSRSIMAAAAPSTKTSPQRPNCWFKATTTLRGHSAVLSVCCASVLTFLRARRSRCLESMTLVERKGVRECRRHSEAQHGCIVAA
jgi:hypothetical protein